MVALLSDHSICQTRNAESWPLSSSSTHGRHVQLPSSTFTATSEFRSAPESLTFLQPIFHRWSTDPETCTRGLPSASTPANSQSLRSFETVPSKPSPRPRSRFKYRHPPEETAPHWLHRCSLTFPGCPSVCPKNCLSGVPAHHVWSLLQRFRQGCSLSLEKVTLLSTALKDLPVLTWGHPSSSCLAAFPWPVHPSHPSQDGEFLCFSTRSRSTAATTKKSRVITVILDRISPPAKEPGA